MKRLLTIIIGVCALLAPAVSLAQTAPLIIDRSRPDRTPPAGEPQKAAPTGSGRVEAAPATSVSFALKTVKVQGSSLAETALAGAYASYIGKTVTSADLNAIADAVGAAYAKSDIALYTILLPRQSFEGGQLRLVAVEGYVSDVLVSGDEDPSPTLTKAYAEKLTSEKPLRRSTLERYVALMRDVPGATVEVQFLQGTKPGAVKMDLKRKFKRLQTSLAINNRGSTLLGRTQVEAGVTANGLLREGDQTRLTVLVPTEIKRFQYVGLTHAEPLGASGASLNLSVGYLKTRPKIVGFDLKGSATTAGAQITYPAIRSNTKNLYLTGGLDGVNSDNALFGQLLSEERTRVARVAAAYSQQSAKQALSVSVTASQGVDGLGARLSTPAFGKADFTKLNGQANLTRQKGQFVVRLAANGQYAGTRLPASEQYALGGSQFGRGFASAVISGDSGYAGSLEVAWRPKNAPKALTGSELYGFTDGGKVSGRNRGIGPTEASISSAGAGVRAAVMSKTVIELEVGKPLSAPRGVSRDVAFSINLRTLF